MTYLLVLSALIVSIAAAAGLMMYRSMFVATRGNKIPRYPNPRKALIVLDLQEGYGGNNPQQPATAPAHGSIFATVNHLIDWATAAGVEVVYVRQVFSNNIFVRMHGGRRVGKIVVDRRINKINDNDFEKNRTDAFSSKSFEQFLIDHQVNELYLTGVDAAYCVYYTALGGRNRGYGVTVVRDAVRSRADMKQIEQRYKKSGIAVTNSCELVSKPAEEIV
jgi:nicotinamidase-related amidase